ncbi:pantoate--beta-alanine ligase [Helicovermis profundi]|uniref:Pantothenate synthetase n=1 Tax=Helicovermis profundi TaxID=3065157 RepID=A0AAU9E2E5_9FIRM|nr:pantoate--beta-alanine ligase [Clostridia bacterium S502]
MKTISKIDELKVVLREKKYNKEQIGFVPTMGFLHEGHASLVRRAVKENDITVVSIFVNPTQFDSKEDLETYPSDLKKDIELLRALGVNYVFTPDKKEMYSKMFSTFVDIEGDITKKLCGASREGHFKGVATVVTKLFNIVLPDKAYFGQKDAQQVAVISRMVKDLNMDVEIIPCPIVREKDGLALSSRNVLLKESERIDALILSKSLFEAKELIESGEKDSKIIKKYIVDKINTLEYANIDYVDVVNASTLEDISLIEGEVLIALAVYIGKPRLIDNIRISVI